MRLARLLPGALALCIGILEPMAQAQQPLPPGPLLQKLSLKLRGISPSASELATFIQRVERQPDQLPALYQATIAEYLRSAAFHSVVESFHSVWWRLPLQETTRLVADIVAADRPYFEIFDKGYLLVDGTTAAPYRRAAVRTEEPLPTAPGDWRPIRLAADETRFRSILSAQDFLNQFPDTPTNRNRARASYVFRTFLCETLAPVADGGQPLLATAHAAARIQTHAAWRMPTDNDDEHGSNPDCIGCHYRLDPMARFFDHWRPPVPLIAGTWYDADQQALGQAIVRDADGAVRTYDGVAESDLARALLSEPRVPRCLVNRAWEYVFGTAVPLPAAEAARLVAVFEERQSFQRLLTEVVSHPYFWSTLEAPPLRFGDVRAALDVCVSCHRPDGPILPRFDPRHYPFLPDADANLELLRRVWGSVNYTTGYAPMPLAPRPKLANEELAKLRDWIVAGARDDTGEATLTDAQIEEVLGD